MAASRFFRRRRRSRLYEGPAATAAVVLPLANGGFSPLKQPTTSHKFAWPASVSGTCHVQVDKHDTCPAPSRNEKYRLVPSRRNKKSTVTARREIYIYIYTAPSRCETFYAPSRPVERKKTSRPVMKKRGHCTLQSCPVGEISHPPSRPVPSSQL